MANLTVRHTGTAPALSWEPFEAMRQLLDWDPFREMAARPFPETNAFVPHFDVKETGDGYIFKADLPGIEEKDLDVSITGTRLTVSGDRAAEQTQEGETFYARERRYGSFSRTFTLPEGIDTEHIAAELRNGIFTLHVPKTPEVKPKRISVNTVAEKVRGMFENKEKASA
jgi:HSP20 family protein